MADWANLPNELLGLIVQRLSLFDDFIVFGAVCKSWKSVSDVEAKPPSPPMFPWLILAEDGDKEDERIKDKEFIQSRRFFNLSNANVYEFQLPEASSRRCLGTHFGWLFTLGLDLQISLLHPFTRHQIPLPPQPTFSDQYEPSGEFGPEDVRYIFIRKAVLSSNPWKKTTEDYERQDCAVMTIYGEVSKLAFARLGDTSWTNVQVPSRAYDDIAFYKGHFYAVDCHGVAVVCDIDDDRNPKALVIAPAPKGSRDHFLKYLVESAGDLLLVSRIREFSDYESEEVMKEEKHPYLTSAFIV
ncbi:hypothetical protein L1049_020343 [Liquidambar formosana]|uniref:F-box protein n=1 Tax=Liquidambar formosana TaxID=63359 RepID=A0AAP0X5Y1_LIQFO